VVYLRKGAIMKMRLINGVILAEDYPRLVKWYEDTFKLERKIYEEEEYHYSEMMKGKNMIFGIADASENGITPVSPRKNTVVIQIGVEDIRFLFEQVKINGGKILFGPTKDQENNFYYGGIADIEGNEIWIIEEALI